MGFLELLLIGVGLSMDAFAVAVCQGLCMPKLNLRHAAVIALFFGGFQALMPLAGWLLGAPGISSIWITGWRLYCWRSSAAKCCGNPALLRRRARPAP